MEVAASPGLPLTVNQQVVEQEEDALLDVACGDFQEVSVEQQLRADICEVSSLQKRKENNRLKGTLDADKIRVADVLCMGSGA